MLFSSDPKYTKVENKGSFFWRVPVVSGLGFFGGGGGRGAQDEIAPKPKTWGGLAREPKTKLGNSAKYANLNEQILGGSF